MDTKDQITIVLKEYDALRKDIEDRVNTPKLFFVPLLIASLAGVLGWKAEASVNLILLFVFPLLLTILSFALNADYYVLRTARQVAKIEDKVFRLSGLSLLTHETEILYSRRQFHVRKAVLVSAVLCIFYLVIEVWLFYGLLNQLINYPARMSMLIFLLTLPLAMFVFAGIRLLLLQKTNLQFRSDLLDKLTSNDFNYLVYSNTAEIPKEELSRRNDKPGRDDANMLGCDTAPALTQPPTMIRHSKIPNIVTFLRLALLVPFIWFVRTDFSGHCIVAALVLIIATVTDLLDGYLARKLNSISAFGDVLDVLADRMLAVVSVMFLMVTGTANFYMGLIVICRELTADSIRSLAARSGTSLPHNIFGQVKLVAIISAAVVALLTLAGAASSTTGQFLANASLVIAVATGMLSIIIMLRSRRARS